MSQHLPSWEEYVQILTERFGDACDDPMAKLMNLRQKGTISEYHEQFDAIMTRLDLPADYSLSCFLGGLKTEVQMMVRMFQPQSVMKAYNLAKLYESTAMQGTAVTLPSKNKYAVPIKSLLGPKPPAVTEPKSMKTKPRLTKNLSPAFMSERRAKGLCYFCDKPFSVEHGLTHKKLEIHTSWRLT